MSKRAELHRASGWQNVVPPRDVVIRCPTCHHQGTLDSRSDLHDLQVWQQELEETLFFGQRQCPNPSCHAHVFVVLDAQGDVATAYPPEVLDFDATDLPESVLESLEEAINCHAVGCYRAAAIMVRRTLEDLCHDRGATGTNLKARLGALGNKVIIPPELLEGLDNLRLLGNDAAHIEAETYREVGEDEVVLAIDVTKEVLKAVYQYRDLVDRLAALKKPPSSP